MLTLCSGFVGGTYSLMTAITTKEMVVSRVLRTTSAHGRGSTHSNLESVSLVPDALPAAALFRIVVRD